MPIAWAFLLAAMPVPVQGPVIALPAFVVRDSRILPPLEKWQYASAPGLEVLSSAPDSAARPLAEAFARYQRGIAALWPLSQLGAEIPAVLLFCGSGSQFAKYVSPASAALAERTISATYHDREMAAFVINLDSDLPADSLTADLLRREYLHLVLSRLGDHPPPWLQNGLWNFFSQLRCSDRQVVVEAIPPASPEAGEQAPPLLVLLTSSAGLNEDPGSAWERACGAFVHYCLIGAPERYRKPFLLFALQALREPAGADTFRACFGEEPAQFDVRLRAYHSNERNWAITLHGADGRETPALTLNFRAARDAEVGRMTGETLRMAERPQDAHWALIAPYVRGARDPDLLSSLGLQEFAAGENDRAGSFLEAATVGGSTRARAWVTLAKLRLLRRRQTGPTGSRLSASELAAVLGPLFMARRLPPPLPDTYQTIADAWELAGPRPTAAHLAVIAEGVARFPQELSLREKAAHLGAISAGPASSPP